MKEDKRQEVNIYIDQCSVLKSKGSNLIAGVQGSIDFYTQDGKYWIDQEIFLFFNILLSCISTSCLLYTALISVSASTVNDSLRCFTLHHISCSVSGDNSRYYLERLVFCRFSSLRESRVTCCMHARTKNLSGPNSADSPHAHLPARAWGCRMTMDCPLQLFSSSCTRQLKHSHSPNPPTARDRRSQSIELRLLFALLLFQSASA